MAVFGIVLEAPAPIFEEALPTTEGIGLTGALDEPFKDGGAVRLGPFIDNGGTGVVLDPFGIGDEDEGAGVGGKADPLTAD